MTVQAAATLAQILPALLAIGLLAPVISGVKFFWRQRRNTLFQSISVLLSEMMLLYSIVLEIELPFSIALFVVVTIVWSLMGVGFVVYEWAKLDSKEKEELDFDRMVSRKIRMITLELIQGVGTTLHLYSRIIAGEIKLQTLKRKAHRFESILTKRGQPIPPRPTTIDPASSNKPES